MWFQLATIPFVLGLLRYALLVDRGEGGAPEELLMRDRVLLVTEGFSAMTSVGRPQSPIDMAVIGFIDDIELMPGVG